MSASSEAPGSRIYLDHASTSSLRPQAREAMIEWIGCADPGRIHAEGRMARFALEEARRQVATLFGTKSRQVIFTSGATEATNAAVFGSIGVSREKAVVMASVEHSAVRDPSMRSASEILWAGVDYEGFIDIDAICDHVVRSKPGLVHCQLANHEVGTVQPLGEVAEVCRAHNVMLHVDAAAGAGHIPVRFDDLGVDLMSISAHKMGGPRGVGALLVRRGLRIDPLLLGGDQERARRAGLENVAAAVGFGAAAEVLASGSLDSEARAAAGLVERIRHAVTAIPDVEIYGPRDADRRLPHLICLGVGGVEAEPVLIGLDQAGVAAHSGSSCSSESLEPSPVLEAMGVDGERSLRLSVGWSTTQPDVDTATAALARVVSQLRDLRAR